MKFMKMYIIKKNINLRFLNKNIILFYIIKIFSLIIFLNYKCIIYIHLLKLLVLLITKIFHEIN